MKKVCQMKKKSVSDEKLKKVKTKSSTNQVKPAVSNDGDDNSDDL